MKNIYLNTFARVLTTLMASVVLLILSSGPTVAQTITEIIDATGDGSGNNPLTTTKQIAVDGSGNAYVTGAASWNAFKITPGGVITEIIDLTGDGAGNTFAGTGDIAVDGAGNVYVTGLFSSNAFKITPGGVITEIIDATGDGTGNVLTSAGGVAVDGSGNVYVTGSQSHNAFKITPGGVITEIIDATGDGTGNTLTRADAVALDASGNVYVTGTNSFNAFKITPGGVITEIIDATGDGVGNTLVLAIGIAVDGSENVYVAGLFSHNAFKITPGGVITEIIDATGDGAGNTLANPFGIAVDGSGNVYVTGEVSDNAFKITPGGVITEIINATGDGVGNPLNQAEEIEVDGSGNVFVTGSLSHNAFKIALGLVNQPPDCSGATIDDQSADANCQATISGADVTGVTDPDNDPLTITVNPTTLSLGANTVTVLADDGNGGTCSIDLTVNVVGGTGTISGTTTVNGDGLAGVTVKLLEDADPTILVDENTTDSQGSYSFNSITVGIYQVMIVEPLGYTVNQNFITTNLLCGATNTVDFNFTEIVLVNEARSKGYWKHQFDVYVRNRGNAQESEQDLIDYIDEVDERYNSLTLFSLFDGMTDGIDDFEEWQDVLSVKGNEGMEAKATAQLAALVLNIMSLKIAQYEVVTYDGKTAGDVLIYVSVLIEDADPSNDELAKDLAESVNNQQMIAAGIVPEGNILFKTGEASNNIEVTTYELFDNYPNPFNPSTKIVYQIPDRGNVSLKIYDMLGKEVTTLVEEYRDEGRYEINFDAGNLASGIYIYQLRANNYIATKKMILMK